MPLETASYKLELYLERDKGRSRNHNLVSQKLYNDLDKRCILQQVQLFPKCTYANIQKACAVTLCDSTLKTILKKYDMKNWRAKHCPRFTEIAAKRLAWCLVRKGWTVDDEWVNYMWPGNCSAKKGAGEKGDLGVPHPSPEMEPGDD